MQINVHGVKNQKKDLIAEIVILQKLLFFCYLCIEIQTYGFCFQER